MVSWLYFLPALITTVLGTSPTPNCNTDDVNCVCSDLSDSTTCYCDFGFVTDIHDENEVKGCTRNCSPGKDMYKCWTTAFSYRVCPVGSTDCSCAFGYTAVIENNNIVCKPVECHKKYLLNNNELCNCPALDSGVSELNCGCIEGYIGDRTTDPGVCRGYQCTPTTENCRCRDNKKLLTCNCDEGYQSLIVTETENGNSIARVCLESQTTCKVGEVLNSRGSTPDECISHVCVSGSPFCDTGSVDRVCEDGYTNAWDLVCIPVMCNWKLLNTDVSFCKCEDPDPDTNQVDETQCRCFTQYVKDHAKPGQCISRCDENTEYCKASNLEACDAENNINCMCTEGYLTRLLDTNSLGQVVNVDTNGRYVDAGMEQSGFKVGCVPVCNDDGSDKYCTCSADKICKCRDGYTPNHDSVCVSYECNAGFEAETYHCVCDQDAFGSITMNAYGVYDAQESEFPLTCKCDYGYRSILDNDRRICIELNCDPYTDVNCDTARDEEGDPIEESAKCKEGYVSYRDPSKNDGSDDWKEKFLPKCVPYMGNLTACVADSIGCQTTAQCPNENCQCVKEDGYTNFNGECLLLTCIKEIVEAQYPGGNLVDPSYEICKSQYSADFEKWFDYCAPGYHANGTGGCDIDCNNYFPHCVKYADLKYFRCEFGYRPNMIGFTSDGTCVEAECNSEKEHCVCNPWPHQTSVFVDKDCECELGYASNGNGGCSKFCDSSKVTEHCNRLCVGAVCECELGYSLIYDETKEEYRCEEITCHYGNGNCSCGPDMMDARAVSKTEEVACECVNNTQPLSDGTCTETFIESCVVCKSQDRRHACLSEVKIDSMRGITIDKCNKHTGYFGCWITEKSYTSGDYSFERHCGYYCTDLFNASTYCHVNDKGMDTEYKICMRCCHEGNNCNIMEMKTISSAVTMELNLLLVVSGLVLMLIVL